MNTLLVLLIAVMALSAGCSLSASSKSSSDSSSASYTEAYVKSGGQFDAFQKRVGELAKKHDITNWEDSMATYEGVGAGLGRARVNQVQVDAYKENLGQGDPKKMEAIQKAYNAQS